ncbi:MAG: RNA 2',3'-cyclic phosphodiesterase [Actinomycetota bacterium]
MARLFVALPLPAPVTDELARAMQALEPATPGARWVPKENLHLTLAFLGRVENERVPAVSEAVGRALEGQVDFVARVGGLGAFPSRRRARFVWAGLHDPTGGLAGLAESIAGALEPLGFEREVRPFQAHVTIARLRTPGPVDLEAVSLRPLSFPVDRVALFESHLRRPAPLYETLATFPFRRGS